MPVAVAEKCLTHFANVDIRVKSELAELHGERPSVLQGVTVRNRGLGQPNYLRPHTSSCSEALSPTPDGSMGMPLVEDGVKDFDVQQRRVGDWGAIGLQAHKPAQGGHEHS